MSVRWSVAKCDNYAELVESTTLKTGEVVHTPESVKTEAMIFALLGVGVGEITAANVAEVWARIALWETLYGPTCSIGGERYHLTADDVFRRIGMTVNASPMTWTAFVKWHVGEFRKGREHEMDRTILTAVAAQVEA